MNIIIAGDGKVGLAITQQLLREGHDLVVIDSNPKVLERNLSQLDVMTIQGNAANMHTLRSAMVENADLLIAATSADEINILCCLTGRRMNKRLHTIARVRSPEYAEQLFFMREDLGLSMAVNPDQAAAVDIFRTLQFPSFLQREAFAKGRVEIVELRVDADSVLNGIQLSRLYKIARVKVLVCAVERGDKVDIPDGNYVLQADDHIYVTAKVVNLTQLIKNLGIATQRVRQVMIIGGGRLSYYLAERLLGAGIGVKIIERDAELATSLAEQLPGASIIWGDGSTKALLDSEGLSTTDALVTLTDIDEQNIVISMYGHSSGTPKMVTKINRLEFSGMFADLGVGTIVSPKELCSNIIVGYVRAMQHKKGSVLALHRIAEGQAEALEFLVDSSVDYCNTPLKHVPLKRGVLIACITHRAETIIPDGNSHFSKGDTVVVVTTQESPFYQMNDIFSHNGRDTTHEY